MIDDELRSMGPEPLTPQRHRLLRAALIDETERTDVVGTRVDHRRPTSRRRRAVPLAAAALVIATASAAAAFGSFSGPDPGQVATLEARAEPLRSVHNPGWRTDLNAEKARCVARTGEGGYWGYAATKPLDRPVLDSDLISACIEKVAEFGPSHPVASPALCRTNGNTDRAGYAVPTVLLSRSSCGPAGLETLTDDDLAGLNRARVLEISLLANPIPCPSREQALEWARRQLEASDSHLDLIDLRSPGQPPSTCFGTYANWIEGTVTIDLTSHTN